jgi:hypothetical protein
LQVSSYHNLRCQINFHLVNKAFLNHHLPPQSKSFLSSFSLFPVQTIRVCSYVVTYACTRKQALWGKGCVFYTYLKSRLVPGMISALYKY